MKTRHGNDDGIATLSHFCFGQKGNALKANDYDIHHLLCEIIYLLSVQKEGKLCSLPLIEQNKKSHKGFMDIAMHFFYQG